MKPSVMANRLSGNEKNGDGRNYSNVENDTRIFTFRKKYHSERGHFNKKRGLIQRGLKP
jgi:hypothetical protein